MVRRPMIAHQIFVLGVAVFRRSLIVSFLSIAAALLAGCSGGTSTGSSVPVLAPQSIASHPLGGYVELKAGLASGRFAHVCDAAAPGDASCHAIIDTETGIGKSPQGHGGTPNALPAGYGPAQLQGAYGIAGLTAPAGNTVAIVDAYNDPYLESDLGVYRNAYGLTPCTTSNGCFRKVNQNGIAGSYPKSNGSWAQETSLDVDMASANCPSCHILVVEVNSASFANLSAGVNTAAKFSGVKSISNSYGGSESSSESQYAANYNHAGIAVTASSGDSGYGAQSPASFGTVVATGGTTLTLSGNSRSNETVWSGAGSGCSAYETQPTWQAAVLPAPGCAKRVIADVSYDADPNTGVAVYDSYSYRGTSGWLVFGGTSVASPAIAAIYALAGTANASQYPASYTYAHYSKGVDLFDITSGSNSSSGCSLTYLCNGEVGYDGPTGLGSPIGVTAF